LYRAAYLHVLPHALDLLALSLMAGASLPKAMQQIAKIAGCFPVAGECEVILAQTQRGFGFAEAMRESIARVNLEPWRLVVDLLISGHLSGGGMAELLRTLAGRLHQQRIEDAEQRANRIPILLLAPLFVCIFPVNFVILFYPLLAMI
jgi:tight adherence protein C